MLPDAPDPQATSPNAPPDARESLPHINQREADQSDDDGWDLNQQALVRVEDKGQGA